MSDDLNLQGIDLDVHANPLQAFQPIPQQIPAVRHDSSHLVFRDTEMGRIEIRALHEDDGAALVQRRYASRGYKVSRSADLTLGAYYEGRLVSTLGVRRDAGVGSLGADASFRDEMAGMRGRNWQLCEFTRLAAEPEGPSKLILASLFHLAYLHAMHHWGADYLVIEVNPRHKAFYRRMLDFQVHGDQRLHRGVGAPAVLMSLSLAYGATQVDRLGGTLGEDVRSRTLFPYFFAKGEERDLLRRLKTAYGHSYND